MTHETWLAIILLGLAIVGAVVAAGRLRRDSIAGRDDTDDQDHESHLA
jgi:hypothetical protein